MTTRQKAIDRICAKPTPADVTWDELSAVLRHFGYQLIPSKRGGSRRKFFHAPTGHVISLHEPHPGRIVARCYVQLVVEALTDAGHIKD